MPPHLPSVPPILIRKSAEIKVTIYRIDGKTLATYSLALVHLIPSWLVLAKIDCTVQAALPKKPDRGRSQTKFTIRGRQVVQKCQL